MKILEIELKKIKPDPNQPRRLFNPDKLEELAKTIRTTGIINPIEVDEDYMIITGENRWRAAAIAGLATAPCKVLKLSDKDRFLRQVIENIQYANLTPFEIAKALEKLLSSSAAELVRDKKHQSARYQQGIKELAEKIGKGESYITMHLDLLKQSKLIQTAVASGLPVTHLQSLKQVPDQYRKILENKMLRGEFKSRDASRYVVGAINRNPDKADEILAINYSEYETSAEVAERVAKISPRISDYISESLKPSENLNQLAAAIHKWCEQNSKSEIGAIYLGSVVTAFAAIQNDIANWTNEIKLIERSN